MIFLGLPNSVFRSQNSGTYSRTALIKLVGLGAALIRSAALIRGFTVLNQRILRLCILLGNGRPHNSLCSFELGLLHT